MNKNNSKKKEPKSQLNKNYTKFIKEKVNKELKESNNNIVCNTNEKEEKQENKSENKLENDKEKA